MTKYVPEPAPLNTDTMPEYTERELRRVGDTFESEGRTVWRDLTTSMLVAKTPGTKAPTLTAFGPAGGSGHMKQYAFTKGDNVWANFHVNHDIKRDANAYIHIHWCTDGTDTGDVVWDVDVMQAKGHNQEAFPADTNFQITQAGSGTAWQHMIAEDSDNILTLLEPDTLILVHIERADIAADTNTDTVFGLFIDLHYEADDWHSGTTNKTPDFWKG